MCGSSLIADQAVHFGQVAESCGPAGESGEEDGSSMPISSGTCCNTNDASERASEHGGQLALAGALGDGGDGAAVGALGSRTLCRRPNRPKESCSALQIFTHDGPLFEVASALPSDGRGVTTGVGFGCLQDWLSRRQAASHARTTNSG